MINVAIHGAAGRMGQRLVALVMADPSMTLTAAVESAGHPRLDEDAGVVAGASESGVVITERLPSGAAVDVIIDFSLPEGTRRIIDLALQRAVALVVGTTGLTAADEASLDEAAKQIPLLKASNFSLVVNVLNLLASQAAKLLGDDYDIEILEAHHRFKKDAPSGTAITLAKHICEASGRDPEKDLRFERHGDNVPRQPKEITIQTLRIGDHVGEHTAYFAALGERLELKHVSTSRDSYALGAVRAAAWLTMQPAGRYEMTDVLGIGKDEG